MSDTIRVIDFTIPCSVIDGQLKYDQRTVFQNIKNVQNAELIMRISEIRDKKSYAQIKAFHGTILDQVRECHIQNEGEIIPKDRLKQHLKAKFLEPQKLFWSDGTTVTQKVEHPDRPNVYFNIAVTKIPSLASLTKEQMTDFISRIIDFYWTNYQFSIVIE